MVSKMTTINGTDRPSTLINDTRRVLHFGSYGGGISAMPNKSSAYIWIHESDMYVYMKGIFNIKYGHESIYLCMSSSSDDHFIYN